MFIVKMTRPRIEVTKLEEKYKKEVVECPWCRTPIGLVRDNEIKIFRPLPVRCKPILGYSHGE